MEEYYELPKGVRRRDLYAWMEGAIVPQEIQLILLDQWYRFDDE